MDTDRREVWLRVGQRLFSRRGYRDVGIQDVAKSAGMSPGSFYNYFPSKEAFYGQILDRIEEQGIRRLERSVTKFRSPINKLRALYRFATLGIRSNPMLRGVLTGDERFIFPGTEVRKEGGPDLRSILQKNIAQIIREGTIKNIFRSGVFRNPNAMVSALYDSILLHLESERIDDLVEDLLLLLERGLKRRVRLRMRDERVDRRLLRREEDED